MIPKIPAQRQKSHKGRPFNQLVAYIEENKDQEIQHQLTSDFTNIVSYATGLQDKTINEEKCIAIRTHAIISLETASEEMNAVANQNARCKDAAFHLILSWPEHEHPSPETIFDAAEHAIRSLGLSEHQYVLAVHGNTDNTHCHIAVNRIHPVTYQSHHIEWAIKTLHLAARQSEIKHGWTHDNGIYIVDIDENNNKRIIINPDLKLGAKVSPHAHADDIVLPAWFDPESLESWLKSEVAKSLKGSLPKLGNWHELHNWLSAKNIVLKYTGGGMRLYATSYETGEVLDLPASRGLRILKLAELEKRWGKFESYNRFSPIPAIQGRSTNADEEPQPCIIPDLSHFSQQQLNEGVEHVLRRSFDQGIPPNPDHKFRTEHYRSQSPAHRRGSLHELSSGGMDAGRQIDAEVLLSDALHVHMGTDQSGQDQDMRRTGTSETGSRSERSKRNLTRDDTKRDERKQQRAAVRLDLRQRFNQYRRFVREGDAELLQRLKEIRAERTEVLGEIREEAKEQRANVVRDKSLSEAGRLRAEARIVQNIGRRKLEAEVTYRERVQAVQAARLPPLGWRVWLLEQSNLGDQGAVSALRGIVYQAQRDRKKAGVGLDSEEAGESSDFLFQKLMARLVAEEKKEMAIRAANQNAMRPYEVDPLLVRYANMQWRVTGNGNIEYSEQTGKHLFTDRGNRITFDRALVTDEEIRVALVHAQAKFGHKLTLTGDDPIFTQRMARLADDMGIAILNPDLQQTIAEHRETRRTQPIIEEKEEEIAADLADLPPNTPTKLPEPIHKAAEPLLVADIPKTAEERLKAHILSIDPYAQFEVADPGDSQRLYVGPIVASDVDGAAFTQRTGRGIYTVHAGSRPTESDSKAIEIRYKNSQPICTIPGKGTERKV